MLARGVHHDLILAVLREGRREAGMAVAARVVVLEVAAALDAGAAQEQVRIERIRFEIDGDRLAGAALNRPGLGIGGVMLEQHVVAGEAALLRLTDGDRVRRAAGLPPTTGAARGAGGLAVGGRGAAFLDRLGALRNRQREATRLPLGSVGRVHENAVRTRARERARHARVAAGTAVVIDDRVVEIRAANDQHRIEIVRGEIDRDRLSGRGGELIELEVAVVGIERVAARQRAVDRLPHANRRRRRRLRSAAVVLAAALYVLDALADREGEAT